MGKNRRHEGANAGLGPARLTGTGSCIFAAFGSAIEAERVAARAPDRWRAFVARGLNVSPVHARLQAASTVVVDLDWSRGFIAGHIPGAWFAIRARLAEAFAALPATDAIVFTSSDGVLARLAAAEWNGRAPAPVMALSGGTAAWDAGGYGLERGAARMASAREDERLRAREQTGSVEDAMRAYLEWEIDLVNQMATDDDQRFKVLSR